MWHEDRTVDRDKIVGKGKKIVRLAFYSVFKLFMGFASAAFTA
jgi:hypothetical protein